MATSTPSRLTGYDWSRPVDAAARPWAQVYDHFAFYARIVRNLPQGLKYRAEIVNLISDITIGAGALVVGGGMFFVIFAMSFFTGTEVGLQGFKGLEQIGAEAFTGVISSVANTREITPLIAGVALAAQVGAGFTAQLGAMRISDEIDALEVMGVDSFQYLVATRVWASLITMIPLYLAALFASYLATELIVTGFFGLRLGPVPALLPPVPAADRHLLLVRQGAPVRHGGDADPLLLRLLRLGRAGRRRPGGGPGHPGVDHRRGQPELRAVAALLGRPGHGPDRGLTCAGTSPPPPAACSAWPSPWPSSPSSTSG